jgi:hypothetical protein
MYVAPRPDYRNDPNFPLRMAFLAAISVAMISFIMPAMPPLLASLPVGLMAGMRKTFDPKKAIGGPLALIVMIWLMSGLLTLLMPWPATFLIAVASLYFVAFYLIQKTGNPIGMLILISVGLVSIIGMNSTAALESLRDTFAEAGIFAMIAIPVLYFVLPPSSHETMAEEYRPANGNHARSAAIRALVLLGLSFWLYSFLDMSNMMMAIAAIFVLCFPTRERLFAEARQRIMATVLGASAAAITLCILTINGHFFMLVGLVFLVGLFFSTKMMSGRYPPMVYQFSLSVALSLIIGALTTQEPAYATLTRVVLTFGGTIVAALTTATLESLLHAWDRRRRA